MRGQSRLACTFGTTCPQSDASAMPAAIRTISSSTIPQGVGFQVERKTAPRRPSSGPVCYAEWKIEPGKAPEDEMQGTILLAVKRPGSHHNHTTLVAIVDSCDSPFFAYRLH
jgi:hypothetical protein